MNIKHKSTLENFGKIPNLQNYYNDFEVNKKLDNLKTN